MSIVLGYDESPGAQQALTTAVDIAARFDEPLVLVYAVSPPGGVGEEYKAHQQSLIELGRAATSRAVGLAEKRGVATVVEIERAKPVQALLDVADRHDARVIVVGTWGETPLRGALLGATPHKLLHLSDRPVLCVPAP